MRDLLNYAEWIEDDGGGLFQENPLSVYMFCLWDTVPLLPHWYADWEV